MKGSLGLREQREQHPQLLDEDPIREAIESRFDGKIGDSYDKNRLDLIRREGQNRYNKKIPPGYKDAEKDEATRFGDLILWYQVIEHAEATKKPVMFVTDEQKEDWWWKAKGRTLAPRPELVEEIHEKAGVLYYQYSPDRFMHFAAQRFGHEAEEAIEEVRQVAERRKAYSISDLAELDRKFRALNLGFGPTHRVHMSPELDAALQEYRRRFDSFGLLGNSADAITEALADTVLGEAIARAVQERRWSSFEQRLPDEASTESDNSEGA